MPWIAVLTQGVSGAPLLSHQYDCENTIQHASTPSNSVRKTFQRGCAEHGGSSW